VEVSGIEGFALRSLIKRNKKLDLSEDLQKWLGKELTEEGNNLLNNSPDKSDLIIRFLIAKKNWVLALGEIKELEEKNRKLDAQIQILRRD